MVTHPSILLIEDSPGECELFRLALMLTGPQYSPGEAADVVSTARVERGPSEAARSASTETMPAAPTSSPSRTHLVSVTRAASLYNPAPTSRCTDRTIQPCEHTDFSPLTNSLAHSRLAVSHQRRDLYRPRQYFRDRASDDAGLWDHRSTDGLGLLGFRHRLRPISDSRWMAGRSLGSPRGAHYRAPLVVDLYGVHRYGSCHVARESRRSCRRADARAVFAGRGRSRSAAGLQSRRHQLVTG